MRLAFLNHNIAWHGGFFRAYHWGRHLARRGHDVTLLTISAKNLLRFQIRNEEGIRLVFTPDLLPGRLRSGWDLWDTIRRIQFLLPFPLDLIHSVDSRPVSIIPAIFLKRLKGTKLVLDWGDWWGRGGTIVERHGGLADRLFAPVETFFEEKFRTRADGSVVLSSALEKRAVALGVSLSSIVRIPHGADVEGIVPIDKQSARKELGFEPEARLLGYVGVLFQRDADLMFQAFEKLRQRNRDVRLLVIGNANYDIPADLIESKAVVRSGTLTYPALQRWIASCDVMWLPLTDNLANQGRWPSKISDYLAAGKPVIATRVGDIASLLEEGECGFVTQSNPEELAAVTSEAFSNSNRLDAMGRRARSVAETRLDWKILTDQLERFYSKVLEQ